MYIYLEKIYITLSKIFGIAIEVPEEIKENEHLVYQFNAEMMRLGFCMSSALIAAMSTLSEKKIIKLFNKVIPILQGFKGDHVKHSPMYPNFPKQVMEASDWVLYINAMRHYLSHGNWLQQYTEVARKFKFETTKIKEIGLITEDQYKSIFTTLLRSNDSLSQEDKDIVCWMMNNEEGLVYPEKIPHKETMCLVAGEFIKTDKDFSSIVHTATDVLRVATYLSEGDVSLAENTKFKSLPRATRREIVSALENVVNEEDIQKHRNKWVRLFHNLHVGEFSKIAPKTYKIACKVRSNKKLHSINSDIEEKIKEGRYLDAAFLLKNRPGDFARRLDKLLRCAVIDEDYKIVNVFLSVVDKVSTRVLMQVLGHFKSRKKIERIIFPKGNTQKAIELTPHVREIQIKTIKVLKRGIKHSLVKRFSPLPSLGTVSIDKRLKKCPLPSQQRSTSRGIGTVARGTRLPLGEKNTIRLFIYWKGMDIDLSATFHDKDFKMLERVAYTNIRSQVLNCCHSGDITRAPNGASEFIDIDISNVASTRIRYITMNVRVYNGPTFAEHEECFAGWMTTDFPDKNSIFDPKKVEYKIDVMAASRAAIPVIFDLKKREAIWCDLSISDNSTIFYGSDFGHRWNPRGNNVENNQASIEKVLRLMTKLCKKSSLYDLFKLHAEARSTNSVTDPMQDINTLFGIEDGTVTPKDINVINSDYLIG